jgi:predicted TIM-barrel fold metal-dependent hydrolase
LGFWICFGFRVSDFGFAESLMIWDVHTHLYGVDGRTPEERMAQLLRYADRMGVERICIYMGFPFLQDPTPEQLRKQNDQALQALAHYHDRAFGFVYVSGNHPEASLREIDRCVKNGPMVGVKLWVARRCSAEQLDPIIHRAAELKAVILQHTWFKVAGNLPGESTPLDLMALARRHPQVPIICGHTGGDWELGIRAIRGTKTLYADTGGSYPTVGFVEMAVRELGAERVIYGSDAGGRSFASQLAKVQGADIPDAAKKLILGENLRRLLLPILQAKGMKP